MEKLELVENEEKTSASSRSWGKALRRARVLLHASVISGLAVLGCVVPGADTGDGDGGNPAGSGGFSIFGVGGNSAGVGGDGVIPGAGGGGVVGVGGNGVVGVGGNGVVGAGGGGIGTGGNGELPEGAEWIPYDGTPSTGALTMERTGTGITASIHAVATADHPNDSASVSLSIPLADLAIDMAKSKGVKFNIHGTGSILFQAQSTHVVPFTAGGNCNPDETSCWNAHEDTFTVPASSTTQTILWNDLTQTWGTDTNTVVLYAADIILLSWIIPKAQAGEFWLSGIELIPDDTPPGTGIAALISEAQYNAIVENTDTYTYEGFKAAAARFPAFAGDSDATWAKREIAMFLANSKRETAKFTAVKEISPGTYCNTAQYPCPAGTNAYYGRGSMQLSWNYNYANAGSYLGLDLLNNPNLAEDTNNEEILWDTGLWFWMYGGYPSAPHNAYKQGLGATIQRINGIECGGGNTTAVNERILNYNNALSALGIDAAGTSNGC